MLLPSWPLKTGWVLECIEDFWLGIDVRIIGIERRHWKESLKSRVSSKAAYPSLLGPTNLSIGSIIALSGSQVDSPRDGFFVRMATNNQLLFAAHIEAFQS